MADVLQPQRDVLRGAAEDRDGQRVGQPDAESPDARGE